MIESFTLDKNFVLTSLKNTEWKYNKTYNGFEIPLSTFSNFDSSLLEKLQYLVTDSIDGHRTYLYMPKEGTIMGESQFIIKDDNFIFKPYYKLLNSRTINNGNNIFSSLSIYEITKNKVTSTIPSSDTKYAKLIITNISSATTTVKLSSGNITTSLIVPYNTTINYTLQSTGSTSVDIEFDAIPLYINTEIHSL